MNTVSAERTVDNLAIYVFTVMGGFVSEHWYEIMFLTFGAVHAIIAFDKWRYERSQRK